MTSEDLMHFVRTRKGTFFSVALHVAVVCWGLFSFSARSMVAPVEDLVPVDVISEDNISKAKAGALLGKKDAQKLLADKIGEKKPTEDIVGKVDTKQVTETDAAPEPKPKPEKPVEKKPDPPKPVEKQPDTPKPLAEKKPDPPKPAPAEKPKPEEKKPDAFNPDQIASVLNKDKPKQPPKPQQTAAATPEPPKHKSERKYDAERISNLLNQKDPTRQAVTGPELNANASLGTKGGAAAENSASWIALFQQQVNRCWKPPYTSVDANPVVAFNVRLRRDGSLEGPPVPVGAANTPFLQSYRDSAQRAIIACAPYNLPAQYYDDWSFFQPVFNEDSRRT
ncbi:cell envelope integrity protein TolA [Bradyrhizobium sp. STM 3809]|uniref:cell envelope integrity protein TolA n=1 Tax=Bradyrhizobium sp. STM 3809 TaxID=551936 RepID=UPI0002409932|nr:cell envelope integrity protein TolA [Bradyrhizobium sp. STM 3809]CCE02442.1 putative TonB protein [Bradyrhizobium sp. STM 3809]